VLSYFFGEKIGYRQMRELFGHGKNGFVKATKLGTPNKTENFATLQPKILLQQLNIFCCNNILL